MLGVTVTNTNVVIPTSTSIVPLFAPLKVTVTGTSNTAAAKQPALALTGQYSGVALAVGLGAMAAGSVLVLGARRRKADGLNHSFEELS